MAWEENFGFFLGPMDYDEEPYKSCLCAVDEDAVFEEARDDLAGFNDWGEDE